MSRVLIIDDDKELCTLMKKCVEKENLSAIIAHGGIEGIRLVDENKSKGSLSLVILDVMMPDINGFQVLKIIRETSNIPVLMLTAKSDEDDKVSGLRLGADDYLTKPFSISELMARVNSLIRRYTTLNPTFPMETDLIALQGMLIDKVNRIVSVNDILVELTGKEFDLLSFLASNKGRVFTKKQIYTQVWEDEYSFDDSNIMSFISKLRKKIEPDPDRPFYILTVRGVGYRFNKEA
ncbi:PhoP family transcriptional regulator [Clostridium carboxidivorans P7]|uniref:Stage 0 sporulation protein A homolog n=1 Tax=Clostridium carboxidivorans P7 TaxID=536227 RepID=C6PTG6_9CLOT|nr:response regulator transcription factor [Clostridium carboxidivorans]AKN33727.1 PhoP family transcriptional regulator [Clostridium carboxidivorans P7]EET87489.1 two component transcriptional regulator, winged helix family [Clostridium carboxidivorans P7]EFG86674.1 response regulator receiver domain protein [Clostridium carboxidivorans P7]